MQLKSSFPLSSANSWEKLQGTNSLCGTGVTQRDQRSLRLTQERYSTHHSLLCITQHDDSSASSWSPPSHHGHTRSTWWEKKGGEQGCSPVPPWHLHHLTLRLTLAKKALGSWWHELSQLHTPKCTISFSGLLWRMCRGLTVFVWQSTIIPHLFVNSRASTWTAMNSRPC